MVVVGGLEVEEEQAMVVGRVQERSPYYEEADIVKLKSEFPEVFSSKSGKANVTKMTTDLEKGTRSH